MDNQNKILSLRNLDRVGVSSRAATTATEVPPTETLAPTATEVPPTATPANEIAQEQERTQQAVINASKEQLDRIAFYQKNGLEYISTMPYVIKRDSNGNIDLQEVDINDDSNQKIIIEPNTPVYLNKSVIDAVDTQFKYFKFPRTIITTPIDTTVINTDIFDEDVEDFEEYANRIISLLEQQVEAQLSANSSNTTSNTTSNTNNNSGAGSGAPPPPNQVAVPNVIGLLPTQAISTIQSVGLIAAANTTTQGATELNNGRVGFTIPSAGTSRPIGSTVTYLVYNYIAPSPNQGGSTNPNGGAGTGGAPGSGNQGGGPGSGNQDPP